jgi:hypothetical protein
MVVRRLGLLLALAAASCAPPPHVGSGTSTGAVPSAPRETDAEPAKAGARPVAPPTLVGLAARDVEGLFGRPRFVRRDGPAQIWQYGTDACTLNLFFYREAAGFRVRHFELRDRSADLASAGGCDGATLSMVQQAR